MRNSLLVGLSLAAAAVLAVLASGTFDLDIDSVVLLGSTVGAVLALVSDGTVLARVGALALGTGLALVGYAVRAAALPDSTGGRAVAVALVIVAVTLAVTATRSRLPLWAGLLGAGTFAGAYERVYAAAPPELASTSITVLTSLVLALAFGFLAATLTSPATATTRARRRSDCEDPELETELETLLSEHTRTSTQTSSTETQTMETAR